MSCTPITNLTLDDDSKAAVERIRKNQNFARVSSATLTAGVFNSIFTKNSTPVAAYNISQTDWNLYSQAMAALPIIQKRAIQKEIDVMILHYQMGRYDHKHIQFWQGMKHGCQ